MKGASVSGDEAFMLLTSYWRLSVLERLALWHTGVEAEVHAMLEMMRQLWMQL